MSMFWQQVIIYGALGLAVTYLVIHYVRRRRIKAGCRSCPAVKTFENSGDGENRSSATI
ncbi:MAG: hypothetical protein JSW34_09360 [Candidatus Zixiibacteriota bacterium]|nr:MAG: hypothetical protein JSW34_09360 [candidate division Zixibacteria bacterium]